VTRGPAASRCARGRADKTDIVVLAVTKARRGKEAALEERAARGRRVYTIAQHQVKAGGVAKVKQAIQRLVPDIQA
jgi:hypothetical protein